MFYKKMMQLIVAAMLIGLTSCTTRLVDYTVISSKNVSLDINKSMGMQVEGKKGYIFGFGLNLKDALDRALESAGPGYDLLVDGVVTYTSYPFVSVVKVTGTAIDTNKMMGMMGEEEFNRWVQGQDVFKVSEEVQGE
jgi:hypothetical protein